MWWLFSRKGARGDTVDDMRGGSAFSDALRFAAKLTRIAPSRLAWRGMGCRTSGEPLKHWGPLKPTLACLCASLPQALI